MLRRIRPGDARMGMFIHSFEGRFSDRPFWLTRFALTDPDDLKRLQASSIDAVVIDTDRSEVIPGHAPATPNRPRATASSGLAVGKIADPVLRNGVQTVARAKREFLSIADDIAAGRPMTTARIAPVLSDLAQAVERNGEALLGLFRLRARDEQSYLHSIAVSALMMNFARALHLPKQRIIDLGMAGLLHDVGKLAIPLDILHKVAPTPEEHALVERHPQAGEKILRAGIGIPDTALDVCLHHHEHIDGSGYPFGISGDRLSLAARMAAICNAFDAMTSDQPGDTACTAQQAIVRMRNSPGQFDPKLLKTFKRSLGIYPIGTLVRLRESSLCIVVADNPDDPTRPTVRSFYSIPGKCRVRPEDIAIANPQSIQIADPDDWHLRDWKALRDELVGAAP